MPQACFRTLGCENTWTRAVSDPSGGVWPDAHSVLLSSHRSGVRTPFCLPFITLSRTPPPFSRGRDLCSGLPHPSRVHTADGCQEDCTRATWDMRGGSRWRCLSVTLQSELPLGFGGESSRTLSLRKRPDSLASALSPANAARYLGLDPAAGKGHEWKTGGTAVQPGS